MGDGVDGVERTTIVDGGMMKRLMLVQGIVWSSLLTSCVVQVPAPAPSPSTSPSPQPSSTPASPSPGGRVPRENRTCVTADHFAKVVWRTGTPLMTFGLKSGAITLNQVPARAIDNPDGSLTYEAKGEKTFYSRIYANNSCFVQIVSGNGVVILEESGQVGRWHPNQVTEFEPQPPRPQPEPNQTPLSMRCSGNIQNDVDFTAFYSRESGFSRIELQPRRSGSVLTAYLSYSGKNEQGQDIWRGSVNNMADVTLVHLSPRTPQRGDEVSVGYDTRWGRATCN